MPEFYQTVGFHFQVDFFNLPNGKSVDVRFQSVSGLDVEFEMETVREGGENQFEHKIPVKTKYSSTVTLKRGLMTRQDSGLTQWFIDAFNTMQVVPLPQVNVVLLDEQHNPLVTWQLEHVWPKSWKVQELHAERSEVLIEQMELNYNKFTIQ